MTIVLITLTLLGTLYLLLSLKVIVVLIILNSNIANKIIRKCPRFNCVLYAVSL